MSQNRTFYDNMKEPRNLTEYEKYIYDQLLQVSCGECKDTGDMNCGGCMGTRRASNAEAAERFLQLVEYPEL